MKSDLTARVIVTLILLASYLLFKASVLHIPILFYDDGEMIYHALAISKGHIPYIDTHTHHFLGYTIPTIIFGSIFGYSTDLLRHMGTVFQVCSGLGLFILLDRHLSRGWALFAALLYISAREPWVNGFPLQYELNLIIIIIFILLDSGQKRDLLLATLLSGLAFTFDQRALALATLPLVGMVTSARDKRAFLQFGAAWAIFPLLALSYLWLNGALVAWWEQTFIFPAKHRVGSLSLWESLIQGLTLHRYLFTQTPWLAALAFVGFSVLISHPLKNTFSVPLRRALLVAPLILFAMAAVGGRDYDYYTITWLPYLAILAGIFFKYAVQSSAIIQGASALIVVCGLMEPFYHGVNLIRTGYFDKYQSDGSVEVAAFLKKEMSQDDSLFIWGYRLDLYVRLGRTSPFPDSTLLFINPDWVIEGPLRWRHIAPKFEYEFIERMISAPPSFLIKFTRAPNLPRGSPANSFVEKSLLERYKKVFEIEREDYLGGKPRFEVYRLIK